ncbi:mediator of RNA polymerase II transcription subunit 6 [Diaporthe helianthi]|uniref:Mediator of RNA polymerase II transcription subunit 6 n=1 Tax=Diaporthe helianthi TaxID=158607 RepID=A0A2P5IDR3_DIAHE|nr:mediator of RNA polymerase II transcription subunit 6 [Diaporthe helianthi]
MGSAAKESAMDEIQWRNPAFIMQNGPLHTNTVLHYFATSPFFDPTSNNNVIQNQAMYNANLFHVLATREAFETRLRSMQGLEYIVAEQPAETGPGQGTGVWVIRKQNRRKRPGQEDELTVHKDYFLVGENLYAAPTFADLMSSRMATISTSVGKILESANSIQKWTPAKGHVYANPQIPRASTLEPKEATPMPEAPGGKQVQPLAKTSTRKEELARLAEESFRIHMKYGGDYMDEIPITGAPGNFHFASTGRNDKLAVPSAPPVAPKPPTLAPLNTKAVEVLSAKEIKKTKSPRPGGGGKSKERRKSKGGAGIASGTPTPS